MKIQKIMTHLWFDKEAEEAANLYVSLFKNSKIVSKVEFGDVSPEPGVNVMTVNFQLDGQEFIALNAGPAFKFNEAISLLVNCESQEEIDRLWNALIADGGQPSMCGWLKDKFGLSWQITPTILTELIGDAKSPSGKRAYQAMLKMKKLDIAQLKAAAKG